jgi:CelD/BcsL family acetyltransferase involved in cellulose biosynthesis
MRGLAALTPLWQSLEDELPQRNLTQAYDWHRSFLETQEPHPDDILFVAILIRGALRAVLPLRPVRLMSGLGRRGLEVPVNPHVPFCDIVVSDRALVRRVMPAVLGSLAKQTGSSWDYLALRRTLRDSDAVECLQDVPGFFSRSCQSGHVDYLNVHSYDELFGALSSHFRNNLRRAHKRAEILGGITYKTGTAPRDCDDLFPEFLAVEASGWKGHHGTKTAIALDVGLRRFYGALMRRFAERGRCRIDVVRHGSRPIAAAFSLVMGTSLYGLKIGYDESYAHIAPGNLLHWYIIQSACEDRRLDTFNMTSDAAWHSQWRPQATPLLDLVVVRPGTSGRIASVEQRAVARARDWRRVAGRHWLVNDRGRRRLRKPLFRAEASSTMPSPARPSRRAGSGGPSVQLGHPGGREDFER